MYELNSLIGWLTTIVAGVLLSVVQELAKKWPAFGKVNQKMLAIALAALAGLLAYLFEFVFLIDLFSDVNSAFDIVRLVVVVFANGQAAYNLVVRS